jgi:hypothetical protein
VCSSDLPECHEKHLFNLDELDHATPGSSCNLDWIEDTIDNAVKRSSEGSDVNKKMK